MANIQEASDSEDRNALHEMLKDVLASTNSVVHQEFVDALGWYGQGSIVDLAFFLNDPDPDVRENAGNKWELAIGEIEDESTKAAIVEETLKSVNDPNLLETVAAQLNGIDEKLAIESICRVMSDINGKARAAVKEPYEFITGEEWTSRAAARAWLQENYTPPSAR